MKTLEEAELKATVVVLKKALRAEVRLFIMETFSVTKYQERVNNSTSSEISNNGVVGE